MNVVFLRRRRLGKGSTTGISATLKAPNAVIRTWMPRDAVKLDALPAGNKTLLVRWGCTAVSNIRDALVLNTSEAIHWASNKKQSRLDMQANGVPVPPTWAVQSFLAAVQHLPANNKYVLRRAKHAQGKDLWSGNAVETLRAIRVNNAADGYVSVLINKVAEYRVFVFLGKVAWVAKKTPGNPQDVAWNVAQGGRFDNVKWSEWPTRVLDAAVRAAAVSKLHFGGVDVMVTEDGAAYVLEVNSAPSQTSPYRQACVAKVIDAVAETGEVVIEPCPKWTPQLTYKSYIHPAIRAGAEAGNAAA